MRTRLWHTRCLKCNSTHLQYVETVNRYFNVLGSTDDGVVVMDNEWPPDIDDDGKDGRLQCKVCGYTWHIDGRDTDGVTTNIDWASFSEVEIG